MDKTIINVGRSFGSGGKEVATILGDKLGIPVYDSELLSKAAEQSGISADMFRESDENKSVLRVGGLFGVNRYGGFSRNMLSETELFKMQSDAIRDIASKGSAIFVGRASDYVLRDMDCLDVFICAPLEARRERVSSRRGISLEEAEALIAKKDKGREKYYNFFTFSNWGVASNYDICIDSSILGIEGTADCIIDFGRRSGLIK